MHKAPMPMCLFGSSPEHTAEGLIEVAISSQFESVTGQLVHKDKPIQAPFADSLADQERLLQTSLELTKLEDRAGDNLFSQ